MTCIDHQRTINRLIDHEVKATDCGELFEHLGMCSDCRRFYDTVITLGAELEKVQFSIHEPIETAWRPDRAPTYGRTDQIRIAPRPSTLAFVIVVMLVVSLLFSVNVTIERPTQIVPSASSSQR